MRIDNFKLPIFFETPGDQGGSRSELEQDLDDMNDDSSNDDQNDDQSGDDQNDDADDQSGDDDAEQDDDQAGDDADDQDDEEGQEEDDKEGKEGQEDAAPQPLSIKAVKAKYPEIFKDFPELRNSIFRNSQFSQHFSDPQEAAEAVSKAEDFDRFNNAVSAGDSRLLISALSENNPKALKGFASSFLTTLQRTDRDLYVATVTPALEEAVALLHQAGEKMKVRDERRGKNMMLAAQYASEFLFGNAEIPDISKRQDDTRPNPEEEQANRERQEWRRDRFNEAAVELGNAVKSELVTATEKRIIRQYPQLPKYMAKKLAEDTQRSIDAALLRDEPFQRQMGSLWKRAAKDVYSSTSKGQLKTTFLARATTLIPGHLNRILKQNLGKDYKPVVNNQGDDKPRKRKIVSSGSSSSHRESVLDPSKIDYSRTSDADIMSGDPRRVTLKR